MRIGPRVSRPVPACRDRRRCACLRAANHGAQRAWRRGPDTGRRWMDGARRRGCRAIPCWCRSRNQRWPLPGWRRRGGCRFGTHFANYQGRSHVLVMPHDRTTAPARLACLQWPARAHVDASGPPGVVPPSVHRPPRPTGVRWATTVVGELERKATLSQWPRRPLRSG